MSDTFNFLPMPDASAAVSVRAATEADLETISRIQAAAIKQTVVTVLGEDVGPQLDEQIDERQIQKAWQNALEEQNSPLRGILVAQENKVPVGFAAFLAEPIIDGPEGPVAQTDDVGGGDPNGYSGSAPASGSAETQGESPRIAEGSAQILAFEIAGDHQKKGHGSRLLSAIADLVTEQKVPGLVIWIVGEDEERVRFFKQAGFGPMGYRRSLDTGAGVITEHLWYAQF